MTNLSNNPANDEIFRIDYSVIFKDENRERLTDDIEFRGNPSSRQEVLSMIARQHSELDWDNVAGVAFDLYRLMNNNARISVDKAEVPAQALTQNQAR